MALGDGTSGGDAGGGDGGAGAGGGGAAGSAADLGIGIAAAGADAAGAGGSAGASAGAGADAGAGGDAGGGGGADPDWYGKLGIEADGDSASNRDWVKSLNIADVDALAKVARDNQKALRESGRIKVPGDGAPAEEVAAFNKAIGVPDDAKGYAFDAPKGADGQPVPLDSALIERLSATALKSGMPAPAFKAVLEDFIGAQLDQAAQNDTVQQEAASKWMKAQGEAGTVKLAAINRAAAALGLSASDMVGMRNVMGADRALTMFATLGAGMMDDVFAPGSAPTRFGSDPAAAKVEMDAMKADPAIRSRAMIKGTPENLRWNRLQGVMGEAANKAANAGG